VSWWWWVLIWVLLLLGAAAYLVARLWGLWGQARELAGEAAIAQRRMERVESQLQLLGEQIGSPDDLAVFADPAAARKARDRVRRAGRAGSRRRPLHDVD
jgi:hypothetical protein